MNRCYRDLISIHGFEDRLRYLMLYGSVGSETFGSRRYLNQTFYRSSEWKKVRDFVIVRDEGCDLAILERPILGRIYIHHLNPITEDALAHNDISILDPENLVCVSFETHNAIHYGNEALVLPNLDERAPNDMCPWKV